MAAEVDGGVGAGAGVVSEGSTNWCGDPWREMCKETSVCGDGTGRVKDEEGGGEKLGFRGA
jgi:hypothetical protein